MINPLCTVTTTLKLINVQFPMCSKVHHSKLNEQQITITAKCMQFVFEPELELVEYYSVKQWLLCYSHIQ